MKEISHVIENMQTLKDLSIVRVQRVTVDGLWNSGNTYCSITVKVVSEKGATKLSSRPES